MGVAVERCLRRSAVVQALVEEWQQAYEEAQRVTDVEELCHECIDLCSLWRHAWRGVTKSLLNGKFTDTDFIGRALEDAIAKTIRTVGNVLASANEIRSRGFEMSCIDELERGLHDVTRIGKQLADSWPFTDHAMITESRAAFERGEYQEIEEVLDDLKGNCA